MTSSVATTRTIFWLRMLRAFGLYLALELVPFAVVKLALHVPAAELAGPYLAFAAPGVVTLLTAMSLRTWEEHGASLRRLALGWGLFGAVFAALISFALFYSGVELHLLDTRDMGIFITVGVQLVLIGSFSMHYEVKRRLAARGVK